MIVIAFVVAIASYKLHILIGRQDTKVQKNTMASISNDYVPPQNLSHKNITFAWMISDFFVSGDYQNLSHGELKLKQWFVRTKINSTTGKYYREFDEYYVPHSPCEYGRNFFSTSKEDFDLFGVKKFQCPDYNNLTIQGNWMAPEFTVLQLIFFRCTGSNCSTD